MAAPEEASEGQRPADKLRELGIEESVLTDELGLSPQTVVNIAKAASEEEPRTPVAETTDAVFFTGGYTWGAIQSEELRDTGLFEVFVQVDLVVLQEDVSLPGVTQ